MIRRTPRRRTSTLKLIRRPRRHPGRFEIRAYLDPVNRCQRLDGLELDDNTIGNQQVEATFTDSVPLVLDFHRNLPPKLDLSQSELHAQSVLIDRLQESRAKNPMDLDGSGEQLGDTLIELLRRLLQRLGVPGVLAFHTPAFRPPSRDVAA